MSRIADSLRGAETFIAALGPGRTLSSLDDDQLDTSSVVLASAAASYVDACEADGADCNAALLRQLVGLIEAIAVEVDRRAQEAMAA